MPKNLSEFYVRDIDCGGCLGYNTQFVSADDEHGYVFKLTIDVPTLQKRVAHARKHILNGSIMPGIVESVRLSAEDIIEVEDVSLCDENPRLSGFTAVVVNAHHVYWSDCFEDTAEMLEVNLTDIGVPVTITDESNA